MGAASSAPEAAVPMSDSGPRIAIHESFAKEFAADSGVKKQGPAGIGGTESNDDAYLQRKPPHVIFSPAASVAPAPAVNVAEIAQAERLRIMKEMKETETKSLEDQAEKLSKKAFRYEMSCNANGTCRTWSCRL